MAESMYTMPFGTHKDDDIEDIETDYLQWLVDQDWFEEKFKKGFDAIQTELRYREQHGTL